MPENIYKYRKLLEESANAVYVNDRETYELLYANENVMKMFGKSSDIPYLGEKCYEFFFGYDKPCEFCKINCMKCEEYLVRELHSEELDRYLLLKGRLIDWNEKKAHVEYISDNTSQAKLRERFVHDYEEKISILGTHMPDSVGVFHFNLTSNGIIDGYSNYEWLFEASKKETMEEFLDIFWEHVDKTDNSIKQSGKMQRERVFEAYEKGEQTLTLEFKCWLTDVRAEWITCTINTFLNPITEQLEVFCCMVNSDQKKLMEQVVQSMLKHDYESIILFEKESNSGRRYLPSEKMFETNFENIEDIRNLFEGYIRKRYFGTDKEMFMQEYSLEQCLQKLEGKERLIINYSVKEEDGTIRRKQDVYTYLNRETGMLCLIHCDVTEKFEDAYRKTEMVTNALELAQKAANVKNEFLDKVTKEMKQPVKKLNNDLNALLERTEGEDKELLKRAIGQVTRLKRMIYNMVDMSEFESGEPRYQEESVFLVNMLEDIKKLGESLAVEKDIGLHFEYEIYDVQMVRTDAYRIKQLFVNLLTNAIDYSESGGHVGCFVCVENFVEEKILLDVTVKDYGIGMEEEFVRRVYRPFERERRKSDADGVGLGLPVVRNIIKQLGGKLWLDSEWGEGTNVSFCVPMSLVPQETQNYLMRDSYKLREFDKLNFKKLRALVAADDEIIRQTVTIRLQKIGIRVDEARDGEQAVNMVAASEEDYYDIVFMQLDMPIKDGILATREIHMLNRQDVQDMPIVAMKENQYAEESDKSQVVGMDYVWENPYELEAVKEILVKEFFGTEYRKLYGRKGFRVVK